MNRPERNKKFGLSSMAMGNWQNFLSESFFTMLQKTGYLLLLKALITPTSKTFRDELVQIG